MTETLRLLARRPIGLLGLGGVIFFLLLAYVAPLVVPLQDAPDVTSVYLSPSFGHPLGTDYQGRDVLNQIVHGGADILTLALLAAFISTLIPVTFCSLSATLGGRFHAATLRLTDVVVTLPPLIAVIVLAPILC